MNDQVWPRTPAADDLIFLDETESVVRVYERESSEEESARPPAPGVPLYAGGRPRDVNAIPEEGRPRGRPALRILQASTGNPGQGALATRRHLVGARSISPCGHPPRRPPPAYPAAGIRA